MTKTIIILTSDVITVHITDPCSALSASVLSHQSNEDGLDRGGSMAAPAFSHATRNPKPTARNPKLVTRNTQLFSIPDHCDAIF